MIGVLAVVTVGLGLSYLFLTACAGVLQERRAAGQEPADGPQPSVVFFLIGCLNEEVVIGSTLANLLRDPRARIVVVDDGSDDDTGAIAAAADPDRVTVVRRQLPEARQGKGKALNTGLRRIQGIVAAEGLDPADVLICVMDADGELSDGCLDAVLPLFRDPEVGGAQLIVRIRNRETLLGLIQDMEFFGLTATVQIGRVSTGTVSLGGNGQFARLTALEGLDRDPWSESLTEDLDLTISLLERGWKLTSTPDAHVSQQAVEQLRPLLRQRTRWYQGHMTCGRRLPELWRSPSLSHAGALEVTAYLSVPWIQVLPWSILFHIGLWETYQTIAQHGWDIFGRSPGARAIGLVLWYLLVFAPCIANGYLYFRRVRSYGIIRSLLLGHLLILSAYISYLACWRAFYRILRKRRGWDKTRRSQELVAPQLVAADPATESEQAGAAELPARHAVQLGGTTA